MDLDERWESSPPSKAAARVTRFLLNSRAVTAQEPPATLVLDFLRRRPDLVGTKEGCKEGDCGACVVLVGQPRADGSLRYRPVTSCLLSVDELDGKHLVTIEGLDLGCPSPVQEKVVEHGASQCGFCTPGIVVSLTSMVLEDSSCEDPEREESLGPDSRESVFISPGASHDSARVERALSGHLCRCTGYRSLRQAGLDILRDSPSEPGRGSVDRLVEQGWLPTWFADAAEDLVSLRSTQEDACPTESICDPSSQRILAGGTDLYVQRGDELPGTGVRVLGREGGLRSLRVVGDRLEIGAQVTFEQLSESPDFRRLVPDVVRFMHWIASLQVRNRATVGGNLVNASPIGDVTVLMLALDAKVRCRQTAAGTAQERELPLCRLYRGYKDLDLAPGELVSHVLLDIPSTVRAKVDFQKVSKRKCLDIATVNSACRIEARDGRIEQLGLAVGGVAPIPLYLEHVSKAAMGKPLDDQTLREILNGTQEAIAPIDDVRGSADYKRSLCRRLQMAHFLDLFPDVFDAEVLLSVTYPGAEP